MLDSCRWVDGHTMCAVDMGRLAVLHQHVCLRVSFLFLAAAITLGTLAQAAATTLAVEGRDWTTMPRPRGGGATRGGGILVRKAFLKKVVLAKCVSKWRPAFRRSKPHCIPHVSSPTMHQSSHYLVASTSLILCGMLTSALSGRSCTQRGFSRCCKTGRTDIFPGELILALGEPTSGGNMIELQVHLTRRW